MSENTTTAVAKATTLQDLVRMPKYADRFKEVLRDKAPQFLSSLLQIGKSLGDVEPTSVLTAAMTAAALDLPINKNLGFAWIVPFNEGGTKLAQFQLGYKGVVQLALRTGQYRNLNVCEVYEGELESYDRLTGELKLNQAKRTGDTVVGYASYLRLTSGFEHAEYWSIEDVKKHANRYSQSFRSGKNSPWKTHFDEMAMKTVLASHVRMWGPMSVQVANALTHDGGVMTDIDSDIIYPDNQPDGVSKPEVPKPTETPMRRRRASATTVESTASTAATTTVEVNIEPAKEEPKPDNQTGAPEPSEPDEDKQAYVKILEEELTAGKVEFVSFRKWVVDSGRDVNLGATEWQSWNDVDPAFAEQISQDKRTMGKIIMIHGKD